MVPTRIPPSPTTIPVELIIAIIEELASDNDKRALCAFSLVCSSLLSVCRKHLFHSFDLRTGSQSTWAWQIVNKFAVFLSQHLHLVPYFRAVHILAVGSLSSHQSWLCTTPSLTYIIRLLTSLHTFELIIDEKSSWSPLPTSLKEALFFMVSRNNLQTLRFTGMTDMPLLLFTRARHLKSFHAHQVSCHVVGLEACQYRDPIFLEELSLGHSTRLLPIFLENRYFAFSSLRKICIDISSKPGDVKLSWSIIARAGDSLRHLEFRHSKIHHDLKFLYSKRNAPGPRLLPYITLQPHTALESFSFTVIFSGDSEEYLFELQDDRSDSDDQDSPVDDFYPELTSHQMSIVSVQGFLPWCHLLQTAPSSLRLVTITMDCYALGKEELRDWFEISDSSKWCDLDTILANSECLPQLQSVIFYVNLPDSSDSDGSDSDSDDSDSESYDSESSNDSEITIDSESNDGDGSTKSNDIDDPFLTGLVVTDLESEESEEKTYQETPLLSLEEAAYFIRRHLKLTMRVAMVEVLASE